jgi:HD-GYP domain-containing protein (c-di-GMP phosphodiesterase class II)
VVPIVYHHHEWFDGQGYMGGLSGESIPLGARILAVADAYVAMTSERSYRPALTPTQAMTELLDKAGTQFDPAVVDVLADILRAGNDRAPGWVRS